MIDLSKNKFVVWGFHNPLTAYDTFKHIHEAFYRALKYMGKNVLWLDANDDLSGIDFSDTIFITQNIVVGKEIGSIPLRSDCFYIVHNNIQEGRDRFDGLDFLPYGVRLAGMPEFEPNCTSVNIMWATDLLPHEIEKNKPKEVFNRDSRVINYVGSIWDVNINEINQFKRACKDNGVEFRNIHGGVSIEDNVRLIQESRFAPAIIGSGHPSGYIPCRIFKNISYGAFGLTNSSCIQNLFKDAEVMYNSNCYDLYNQANWYLNFRSLESLHRQMDFVAESHTYLNRVQTLLDAVKIRLEMK